MTELATVCVIAMMKVDGTKHCKQERTGGRALMTVEMGDLGDDGYYVEVCVCS